MDKEDLVRSREVPSSPRPTKSILGLEKVRIELGGLMLPKQELKHLSTESEGTEPA